MISHNVNEKMFLHRGWLTHHKVDDSIKWLAITSQISLVQCIILWYCVKLKQKNLDAIPFLKPWSLESLNKQFHYLYIIWNHFFVMLTKSIAIRMNDWLRKESHMLEIVCYLSIFHACWTDWNVYRYDK